MYAFDDFDRANVGPPMSMPTLPNAFNWLGHASYAGLPKAKILGNRVSFTRVDGTNTSIDNLLEADVDLGSPDHYAQVVGYRTTNQFPGVGPACRLNAATRTGYVGAIVGTASTASARRIYRYVNGVGTVISAAAFSYAEGSILRLSAKDVPTGVELKLFINGILVDTIIDTSGLVPSRNKAGMWGYPVNGDDRAQIDNFEANPLSGGSPYPVSWAGGAGNDNGTATITIPANIAIGDVIFLFQKTESWPTDVNPATPTDSSGEPWTQELDYYSSSLVGTASLWWRKIVSGDAGRVITIANGDAAAFDIAGVVVVVRGADLIDPVESMGSGAEGGAFNQSWPDFAPGVANTLLLLPSWGNDASASMSAGGSRCTHIQSALSGFAAAEEIVRLHYRLWAPTTSTSASPAAQAYSASRWSYRRQIAIRPASVAPTAPSWKEWNGTSEVALTLEGVWNGTTIDPIASTEIAA